MFNKDKVKGHNRLVKSKKGFHISIVKDFFRKKNEERNRNIGIGLGATAVIGLGAAILLKKKGINLKSVIPKKKTNDMVVKVDVDNLNLTPRPGDGNPFSKEALEKFKRPTSTPKVKEVVENVKPTSPKEVVKIVDEVAKKPSTESVVSPLEKKFDPLPDPWTTPIPSKSGVRGSTMVVKKPVTQNRIRRKDNIPDPWETPIKTKINSLDMVVPKTKERVVQFLLPAKKK